MAHAKGSTYSETGKVLLLTGYGGYDKVKLQHESIRSPGQGQVLVNIKAAAINFADLMLRQGCFDADRKPNLPSVLGLEGSGVIHSVGKDVTGFKVSLNSANFGQASLAAKWVLQMV